MSQLTFDTPSDAMRHWYDQNRDWWDRPPADGEASILPSRAVAHHADRWRVTYTVGETPLRPGSVVCLESSILWEIDFGRCFETEGLQPAGTVTPGMGVAVAAETAPTEAAQIALDVVNTGRFHLCYATIEQGELAAGQELTFILGAAPGSKLRCQRHAQDCVLAMGVDFEGDGDYRRTEPQPTVEVVGGFPRSLRVVAQATVHTCELFSVRIYAADGTAQNPSDGHRGTVRLRGEGVSGPETAELEGITDVTGFRLDGDVGYVTACDEARGIAGKSSAITAEFVPGMGLYFGDLHGQVYASIGAGTLDEYFAWGRDVERLDFCASANHYGGRRHVTRDEWQRVVDASNGFHEPGRYVTFVSYEWGGPGGHRNVYYRGDEGEIYLPLDAYSPRAPDPNALWELLGDAPALTIPHHPNYIGGTDWSFHHPERQRLVEIASKWGISEDEGPSSAQVGLMMGHRVGFVGGTDTHAGQPGHGPHHCNEGIALTAAYAPELTREAIWDALHERRCYAVFGDDRIVLDFTLNDAPMGRELDEEEIGRARALRVRAAARDAITAVELIRNAEVIHRAEPGSIGADIEWTDADGLAGLWAEPASDDVTQFVFYYARVTTAAGNMAWSSPVWINR